MQLRRYSLASAAMLFDPRANLEAGVKYLKGLLTRFDGNLTSAIAAYNAGPDPVRRCPRPAPRGRKP